MIKKLKSRRNIESYLLFLETFCHGPLRNRRMAHSIGVRTRYVEPLSVTRHKQSGVIAVSFRCNAASAKRIVREDEGPLFGGKKRTRRRGSSALVGSVAAHASVASRRMRRQRRGACVGDGQERAVGIDRRLAARAQSFTSRRADCVATAT